MNFLFPSQVYAAPSVILSGGFTEAEAQAGAQQRKIVYASNNWYAFYNDASSVFYKKSSDGINWGSAVTLDSTNIPFAPTAWVEGTTIYAGWLRDTGDTINVNTINTASSDALGTQCTTGDVGTFATTSTDDFFPLAVADNGTVYLAVAESSIAIVEKLTFVGCTFTDITTGSGLTTNDSPAITTIGNNLRMVFVQDFGGLGESVYDGTSWTIVGGAVTTSSVNSGGGRSRKVAFVNGNWYTFFSNTTGGSGQGQLLYRKSADGITWGQSVVVDGSSIQLS